MNPPDDSDLWPFVMEGSYLETGEGLFFAVKGLEHPPDRWIAVLRYAPDPERGERIKNGVSYRRLYHFEEQERLIRTKFPQYLAYDGVFQTTLQSVPRSAVVRIHDPRRRLQELDAAFAVSPIEADARDFLRLLQKESRAPSSALGITGSLLAGLYTEHSDLDVMVFGVQSCRKVYETLRRLLDAPHYSDLRPLDSQGMRDLFAQRAADTHMSYDAFAKLEARKVNQGFFRERPYFIRFIKDTTVSSAGYGRVSYTPLGNARISACISEDQDAIFTPCKYLLTEVRILEGPPIADLDEIVSFRGRFCEQAFAGESVYASGTLERLEFRQGKTYHRLLLGNSPEDTLQTRRGVIH
jgi:predicted nucleotidyltransferase